MGDSARARPRAAEPDDRAAARARAGRRGASRGGGGAGLGRGEPIEIPTPLGPARVHVRPADEPRGALVLGHGAGGGVDAPDLVAAADAASSEGFTVALVEHPYRVAGRRSPPAVRRADDAWTTIVASLRAAALDGLPLVVGGRSWGGRVACRTAAATGAFAVLCLAFPLQPPRGAASRLPELDAVELPTLVVQGSRDPFGVPPATALRTVTQVPGDHGLKADLDAVADAVQRWLRRIAA